VDPFPLPAISDRSFDTLPDPTDMAPGNEDDEAKAFCDPVYPEDEFELPMARCGDCGFQLP
jgi:hypothetical protein